MGKRRDIRLSEQQIHEHINVGLENLRDMCSIYDRGRPSVCFAMANEVSRIVSGKPYVCRISGSKLFSTVDNDENSEHLMPEVKLIFAKLEVDITPTLDYIPAFKGKDKTFRVSKFLDWWNRDVIYRAGAAGPGIPPDMIPIRIEDQVPYDKRTILTRRTFVKMMRDKFGAHLDEKIPEMLDNLQRSHSFGLSFAVSIPAGELSTLDGTIYVRTGPAAAMMRQISHEVLAAYAFA